MKEGPYNRISVTKTDRQKQLKAQGCRFSGQEYIWNHEIDPTKECYCGRPNLRKAQAEPVAWVGLSDSEWVNIVNHPEIVRWDADKEDAINLAVKLTEQQLKMNNAAPPSSAQVLEELEKERECSARNDAISFDTIDRLSKKAEMLANELDELIKLAQDCIENITDDEQAVIDRASKELAAYRSQHGERDKAPNASSC